jgi:Leucine-rich repeat (LRR) protein
MDMSPDMLQLSQVGKTIDGEGFAYLQVDCVGKGAVNVDIIKDFEHLREIDFSDNKIENVAPIAELVFALKLTLAKNQIVSIASWKPDALPHLLHCDLSGNRLAALPRLYLPALQTASFARNLITTCTEFDGHKTLRSLDLSENSLEHLSGLGNMPLLEMLNVSKNSVAAVEPENEEEKGIPAKGVKSIDGLCALPSLKTLDISKNIFETLTGQWGEMEKLETLIVSENSIAAIDGLKPLSGIKGLKNLDLTANKVEEEGGDIRIEVLICNPGVAAVNGTPVEEEERVTAKDTNDTRIAEERARLRAEEEARLEAEEAARQAAEAEAGGDDA